MDENPYQPPAIEADDAPARGDLLRLPAIGCMAGAALGIFLSASQFLLAMRILQLALQAGNNRAADDAREMAVSCFGMAGLSLLATAAAVCIFKRRFRWLVLLAGFVGVVTCLPAPLAAIILLRLRRKDVWNSFR